MNDRKRHDANSRLGRRKPETDAVQALHAVDRRTGAIVPGIEPATTFARDSAYNLPDDFSYARETHPNAAACENVLTAISGGEAALVFNSGMTAIASVFETVRSGQHVVAPQVMYYGAQQFLRRIQDLRGVSVTFFDQTQPNSLVDAVEPGRTEIVWIETAVNPTWDVIDISAAAQIAHSAGALLGVDATISPPCTTDAIALGADIVFHSATKYLGGHSDLTAGALVTAKINARWQEISEFRKVTGGVLGPFDAWLLLRGMRTLFVRYERASANALTIAQHFEGHPKITMVLYPGLASHPGHEVAARQMPNGFGGMLSLLVDGDGVTAKRIAGRTRVFLPATSLGGVESLIEHRKSVEGPHSSVPENLLRLSIGIEAVDDLIVDLTQALEG
ncbi:MAG: trans-sulfuration enzyme family protein [Hyphomicrobiaceae bacterium]